MAKLDAVSRGALSAIFEKGRGLPYGPLVNVGKRVGSKKIGALGRGVDGDSNMASWAKIRRIRWWDERLVVVARCEKTIKVITGERVNGRCCSEGDGLQGSSEKLSGRASLYQLAEVMKIDVGCHNDGMGNECVEGPSSTGEDDRHGEDAALVGAPWLAGARTKHRSGPAEMKGELGEVTGDDGAGRAVVDVDGAVAGPVDAVRVCAELHCDPVMAEVADRPCRAVAGVDSRVDGGAHGAVAGSAMAP